MSDHYDPDERFSLWPMEAEDGLRRLLGVKEDEPTEQEPMKEEPEDS